MTPPPMENDPSEGIREMTPSEGIREMTPSEGIKEDWQDFVVNPSEGIKETTYRWKAR